MTEADSLRNCHEGILALRGALGAHESSQPTHLGGGSDQVHMVSGVSGDSSNGIAKRQKLGTQGLRDLPD